MSVCTFKKKKEKLLIFMVKFKFQVSHLLPERSYIIGIINSGLQM